MSFNREDINIRNDTNFVDGPNRLGSYTRSLRKNERPDAHGFDNSSRGGNNELPMNQMQHYSEYDSNSLYNPRQAAFVTSNMNDEDYTSVSSSEHPCQSSCSQSSCSQSSCTCRKTCGNFGSGLQRLKRGEDNSLCNCQSTKCGSDSKSQNIYKHLYERGGNFMENRPLYMNANDFANNSYKQQFHHNH